MNRSLVKVVYIHSTCCVHGQNMYSDSVSSATDYWQNILIDQRLQQEQKKSTSKNRRYKKIHYDIYSMNEIRTISKQRRHASVFCISLIKRVFGRTEQLFIEFWWYSAFIVIICVCQHITLKTISCKTTTSIFLYVRISRFQKTF